MLYFGPETLMPVASILAGIVGAVLMFFRQLASGVKRGWVAVFRRRPAQPVAAHPAPVRAPRRRSRAAELPSSPRGPEEPR